MGNSADDGCRELAAVCARIVAADPGVSARDFLRALGRLVAGIDPGVEGIFDLARGGSNEVSGKGFRPEFDDGSAGQARHFAGTAASVAIFGSRATELVAHTVVDRPNTPDARLSSAAIEFATLVLDGELTLDQTSRWILDNVCADEPVSRINPDPRP